MKSSKQHRSMSVILSELADSYNGAKNDLEESICLAYKREQYEHRAKRAIEKKRLFTGRRRFILARDEHKCLFCGAHADTVDHYVPKSCGGRDKQTNMFSCCKICNNLKTDMHPNTFASVNGFSLHEIEKEMQRRVNKYLVKKKDWCNIKKLKEETERINNEKNVHSY